MGYHAKQILPSDETHLLNLLPFLGHVFVTVPFLPVGWGPKVETWAHSVGEPCLSKARSPTPRGGGPRKFCGDEVEAIVVMWELGYHWLRCVHHGCVGYRARMQPSGRSQSSTERLSSAGTRHGAAIGFRRREDPHKPASRPTGTLWAVDAPIWRRHRLIGWDVNQILPEPMDRLFSQGVAELIAARFGQEMADGGTAAEGDTVSFECARARLGAVRTIVHNCACLLQMAEGADRRK